ncbi:hypothetical protein F5883DRAFT_593436 [Diaporthe sp. PMI_573]|nr:hypothetical protein F5883DRAFT_593436 [Diaporthaceae sp. PMI_573]
MADLQARLSAAQHHEAKEIGGLKDYLLHDLKVDDAWKKLHCKANGMVGHQGEYRLR